MENSDLMDRNAAADFLGLKYGTLSAWACNRRYALPYYKSGSRILYKKSDLLEFLESRAVRPSDNHDSN